MHHGIHQTTLVAATLLALLGGALDLHSNELDAEALAKSVTISRDEYGVPHIDGPTDASVIFGFAYAQAEDHFWQIEDSYALALGRYSELHGEPEFKRDWRNRLFRIAERARADYESGWEEGKFVAEAFTAGLNYWLAKHSQVKPRLFERFEPWFVLAYARALSLELTFGQLHVPGSAFKEGQIWARRGSNAWAISGRRTASGKPMLLINPHQPFYGFGQFYEVHMRSGEGWNFTGATFPGSPIPSLGHNEHAGWAFTVNEPDVADVWRVVFDHPEDPLKYRHGDEWRRAEEWKDTIRVRTFSGIEEREYGFRRTHHGPIVGVESASEGKSVLLAGNIARLEQGFGAEQALALLRVENLGDFKRAMGKLQFHIFNAVYADRHGDIYYLYNGIVPRRDARFDWTKPVNGNDPRTDWKGIHPLEELPQIENPACGWLQSCNSTPFLVVDDGNPSIGDFPPYMVEDRHDDKRRSRNSRRILRGLEKVTFERFHELAFDTTLYWPFVELPRLRRAFAKLHATHPELAEKARPYIEHFAGWDCRVTEESTQATLCVAWYQELYGKGYPGETLKREIVESPERRFEALVAAAEHLESYHETWKVPYGEVNRLQRHPRVVDFYKIPFNDERPSLPCVGAPGPLGTIFTVYFTPSVRIPFLRTLKNHYAIVGTSYMAVVEFGDRVRGRSLLTYGQSGDPDSPHFFDQAKLYSERRMKPQYFHREDVEANAVRVYHPGE